MVEIEDEKMMAPWKQVAIRYLSGFLRIVHNCPILDQSPCVSCLRKGDTNYRIQIEKPINLTKKKESGCFSYEFYEQ